MIDKIIKYKLRNLLTIGCIALCTNVLNADDLVVRTVDGLKMYYNLDNNPVLGFSDDKVIIKNIEEEVRFQIDEVDSIYYEYSTITEDVIPVKAIEKQVDLKGKDLYIYDLVE